MKRQFLAFLALTTLCGSIFGAATEAQAGTIVKIKDLNKRISIDSDFNGKETKIDLGYIGAKLGYPLRHLFYGLSNKPFTVNDDNGDTLEFQDISSDPDPVGTFAVAFTDNNAPSFFNLNLHFLISPTIGQNDILASASLGLSMTESSAKNGISITPNSTLSPQTVTSYKFYGPNGNAFLSFGLGGFEQGSGTTTYDYASLNNVSDICVGLGGCTSYDIKLNFLGSGGGDKYAFTGDLEFDSILPAASFAAFSVQPVPEPLTMMGAAMALGFGTAFKRKLGKKKLKSP